MSPSSANASDTTSPLIAKGSVDEEYSATALHHHSRFCNTAYRILRNRDEAEDVVQEAYLRALTHLDQFEGRAALSTWMNRIVANEALIRLRRRVPSVDYDEVVLKATARGPEDSAVGGELLALVLASVQELPEPYRTAFLIRVVCERNAVEAAALLGVTVGCVKTRLHRAKVILCRQLETQFGITSAHGVRGSSRTSAASRQYRRTL